ncbi:hypothetical protein KGF56_000647 [Candida oxycetoniae]|uniref:Uncharacterized protein n=1 Tax=Candida oxycetoniae TaxID=497107 RepID=A0AAI9T151_9ASCO|nr:uncharacterized protein KGF56_000647 [Candida oxycetoniae]KAI3406515.1 hypothetical protein KGF56_000647 [Candida oxycetoniae]
MQASYQENVHHLHRSSKPLNLTNPIRLAFLGGAKSGKTSIISKLTLGNFMDTYYPTNHINPVLFNYEPKCEASREILSGSTLSNGKYLNLSLNLSNKTSTSIKNNGYYSISSTGEVSPILVELIDTPSFNPQTVVPFLEASLYAKLDRDVLYNLANEPRRSVSTNPLLVASGASELNGNIDGYFLVYSAIPSYNPPDYESDGIEELARNHTFNILPVIGNALSEAWGEYNLYKENWKKKKERDMFSFKSAFKGIWNDELMGNSKKNSSDKGRSNKSPSSTSVPAMERAPFLAPPIWIVCTHADSQLASNTLLENGKKLSREWKCGFIAVDYVKDNTCNILLPLMIRDIIEKQKKGTK